MKAATVYLPAAFLLVALVFLWRHHAGPDDGMPPEQRSATFVNDGMPADGEGGIRRDRQHQKSKTATRDRSVTDGAQATAIRGILDGNADLLRQAIGMDPDDPHLLFLGATHSLLSPAEHLEMSRRLHELAPQNALAAFIHAAHLLKTGDSAAALDILRSSGTRPGYNDYINETWRLMDSALIQAGHSPIEAKAMGFSRLEAGYLTELRDAVGSLVRMARDAPADEAAAMRSLASFMSRRISDETKSATIINQLVGLGMEESILEGMADDQPSPYEGLTVAEARNSIEAQRRQLMELTASLPDHGQLLRDKPETLGLFLERSMRDGEVSALQWLRDNR